MIALLRQKYDEVMASSGKFEKIIILKVLG